jgi:hypothetical protein
MWNFFFKTPKITHHLFNMMPSMMNIMLQIPKLEHSYDQKSKIREDKYHILKTKAYWISPQQWNTTISLWLMQQAAVPNIDIIQCACKSHCRMPCKQVVSKKWLPLCWFLFFPFELSLMCNCVIIPPNVAAIKGSCHTMNSILVKVHCLHTSGICKWHQ